MSEDVIRLISAKKGEPDWLVEWRLRAYRHWITLEEPQWQNVHYGPIDYQDIVYYAAPKPKAELASLDEVDPEVRAMFDKLGYLSGRAGAAQRCGGRRHCRLGVGGHDVQGEAGRGGRDLLFVLRGGAGPSRSGTPLPGVGGALPGQLLRDAQLGGVHRRVVLLHPQGRALPDGAVHLLPHQRGGTGQFERTLIVAEEGADVSYLEGCTAPMRDENQLHAAVVELVALEGARIKYSTVQNWYPGDADGRGGIYNFVTKRGKCAGANSKISWTQVETGSAITWKYPGVILQGDNSVGEFYSVALTANRQQADTGTKMIHIGKNTRSTIVSKAISAGHGQNTYRGLVKVLRSAEGARNHTRCDSLLLGSDSGAHTFPYIEVKHPSAQVEHEASTSKVSEDQLFYCRQRGISEEDAVAMIVNGFCREVFKELPMEFAVEAHGS